VLIYVRETATIADISLPCDHTPTELVDVKFVCLVTFIVIFMFYVVSDPFNIAMYHVNSKGNSITACMIRVIYRH